MENMELVTIKAKELLLKNYKELDPKERRNITNQAKKILSIEEYTHYKNLKNAIKNLSVDVEKNISAEDFYNLVYHNLYIQKENTKYKYEFNEFLIKLILNTLNKLAKQYNITDIDNLFWTDKIIVFPKFFWVKISTEIIPKVPNTSEQFLNKYSWQLILGICKRHSKEIENALLSGKIKDMDHFSWFVLKIIQKNILTSYIEIINQLKQREKIRRLAEKEEKVREICERDSDSPPVEVSQNTPFVPMFDYSDLFE